MPKTYITLGRLGDVINMLPLLKWEADHGNRCRFVVAHEYITLLDGCSYLDPISFDGPYWELDRAVEEGDLLNGEVVVAQTNGPLEVIEKYAYHRAGQKAASTDSFVKEQWKLAGKLDLWREQPPLVFDQRSDERENALLLKNLPALPKKTAKKILLVSLTGNTAPFPYADLLWALLDYKLSGWKIVDLSKVQADHFYDLIALYEEADALICCDSAPLHLAQAVKTLPVLALINDTPSYWHGSPWRPNHVWHCRYSDFAARAMEIFNVLDNPCYGLSAFLPSVPITFHLTQTPTNVQGWIEIRIEPGIVGKDTKLIGDQERHPFLRGVLQIAFMKARPDDTIVLTRPNTKLKENPAFTGPCYAHRMVNGNYHPSVDLFAATRKFWESIWEEIPDMVMGKDRYWSRVLCEIFKENGAEEWRNAIYTTEDPKPARFKRPNTALPPRLAHNQKIADEWISKRGIKDDFPAIIKQAKELPLNASSLPVSAYNPSICRFKDRIWMAYRYHTHGSLNSHLGIAEIEPHGTATRTARLNIPGHSLEDPRFFTFQKQRWMSWVESDYSGQAKPFSVVKLGKLNDDWTVSDIAQPDFGHNDWTAMEKNWVFFDFEDRLFCIYQTQPDQTLFQFDPTNGEILASSDCPNPSAWAWGIIHGGFIIGERDGKLLRMFHSSLDYEEAPWRRRYFVGAMLMEPKPPFEIIKISSEPILVGSTDDEIPLDQRKWIPHFKGRVVIPGGAIRLKDSLMLAVGVNDCQCKLLEITDLKL